MRHLGKIGAWRTGRQMPERLQVRTTNVVGNRVVMNVGGKLVPFTRLGDSDLFIAAGDGPGGLAEMYEPAKGLPEVTVAEHPAFKGLPVMPPPMMIRVPKV